VDGAVSRGGGREGRRGREGWRGREGRRGRGGESWARGSFRHRGRGGKKEDTEEEEARRPKRPPLQTEREEGEDRQSRDPDAVPAAVPVSGAVSLLFVLLHLLPGCGSDEAAAPVEEAATTSVIERRTTPLVPDPPFESRERGPGDGEGTATVSPDSPVPAGTPGTWTVTYTVGEKGIAQGGGIDLVISPYWGWSLPQDVEPRARGYTTLRAEPREARLSVAIAEQQIFVRVEEGRLHPGETIVVVYGDTSEGAHPGGQALCDKFAEKGEDFHIRVDGDGDGFYASLPFGTQPSIDILGREAVRLRLFGPSLARVGDEVRYTVAAVDALDNRAGSFAAEIRLEWPEGVREGAPETIVLRAEDGFAASFVAVFETAGTRILLARCDALPVSEVRANPLVVMEDLPGHRLFWGDLQVHGNLCDGSGSPEEVYAYGRDVAHLDVCVLTTHDAWGLYHMDDHPEVWERARQAAEAFHRPREFVTFVGYEYTGWTSGHKHVLFPGSEGRVVSYRMDEGRTPDLLWKALAPTGAMTISHHPGGGPIGEDWTYRNPERETVVEICSVHGSSESYGCDSMIYRPQKGGFVQDALARGLRLGFVGSGDTHNGHPGMGDRQAPTGGLAAIFAPELTREAIFEALRERRVYATSGPRIVLTFSVAAGEGADRRSASMGGELTLLSAETPRELRAVAIGCGDIRLLEVVKNGETVLRRPGQGPEISLDVEDGEPARAGDYYYVRVTQQDGGLAWSSPVWVDLAPSGS